MIRAVLIAMGLTLASAHAQESAPQREYALKLNMQELKVVGVALQEMPFKEVAQLLAKINKQITDQQNPPKQAPQQ